MSAATASLGLSLSSNRVTSLIQASIRSRSLSRVLTRQSSVTNAILQARQVSQQTQQSRTTIRHVSTTVGSTSTSPAQPPSNTAMNWNTFFGLRTSRRRFSLASSILSSIGATVSGIVFLSSRPEMADEVTKLIPMDPVISMGILTFVATFVGWLAGPIFGNTMWKMLHRARLTEFTVKERTFFDRIKRHRVNPQGASTNNPVPDYYGEKIGSVSGYRRWLKDQRAFNRKKEGTYPGGI